MLSLAPTRVKILSTKPIFASVAGRHDYSSTESIDELPSLFEGIEVSLSFALIIVIFAAFYYLFINDQNISLEYALVPDIPENLEPVIEKTIMEEQINNKNSNEENISSSSAIASQNIDNLNVIDKIIILKFVNPTWIQVRDSEDIIIISKLMKKMKNTLMN